MKELVEYLKQNHITVATCESCTGGMLASQLCDFSGISSVFKGSIVTYQNEIKEKIVHVSKKTIEEYGVVSEQVALEMAKNTKELMKVDLCISYTGNAGPDVCDSKPVGTVFCGVAFHEKTCCFELHMSGNRNEIRKQTIEESVKAILAFLKKNEM